MRRLIKKIVGRVKMLFFEAVANKHFYTYLSGHFNSINDVDLAKRILGVELFRKEISPQPISIAKEDRILVLSPHQDDEAIGCGGFMFLAHEKRAEITVMYITDGAQNQVGSSVEESVKIRFEEAKKACDMVNAQIERLDISNIKPRVTSNHVKILASAINRLKPTKIMIPWFLDAPVKHRMTNHLLALATPQISDTILKSSEVLGYQVHNTLYPNAYVDITNWINQKDKMIKCFKTQLDNLKCYDHIAYGAAAWNSRFLPYRAGEIEKKYIEVFLKMRLDEYVEIVNKYYCVDLNVTYNNDADIIESCRTLLDSMR